MDHILRLLIQLIMFWSRFSKFFARFGIGSYEEWKPGGKLKLLMVGYNGARNTGADARVVAAVKQIKELFGEENLDLSVITINKENVEGYFDDDVNLYEISTIYLKDLYRACCSHHAAVLCEGSTLKSKFANALSLFFCEASGIMEKQNKPCIAFGSEVGYMEDFLKKFAARSCRSTYFITRTRQSQETLQEVGLKGHIGTDTAWLYEGAIREEEAGKLLRDQGWDGEKPLVGAAVIDPFCWPVRASLTRWIRGRLTGRMEGQYDRWYFYSDSARRREAFEGYIDQVARALTCFCESHDCFPVLLGMERMDVKACKALMQRLDRPCAVFLSGDNSCDIMAGILNSLSALITSRYHAAVLSMRMGCPIVSVSMDERLDSLMQEIAFDKRYLHHVSDEDLGERILWSLEDGYSRREDLRSHIHNCCQVYRGKQEEMGAFLKDYIINELKQNR